MLAGRREAVLNPSNIRLIRLRLNIHQEEMANKISSILAAFVKSKLKSNPEAKVRKINSVSESTFGSIERGKRLVSAEMSKIISNILRVPPTKLFKFVRHNKYVAIINKSNV
jgi:transcriptional regulator with XRE-family HTH domain